MIATRPSPKTPPPKTPPPKTPMTPMRPCINPFAGRCPSTSTSPRSAAAVGGLNQLGKSKQNHYVANMKLKAIVHDAEEGGFWAEVPAVPGCVSQGETMEELLINLREAIEGCLAIDIVPPHHGSEGRILEIAV